MHALTLKAAKKAVKKAEPKKTARAPRVKMSEEEKGQRRREKAVTKELEKKALLPAQAEPMMPAPVVAPSLAPGMPKGGRTRRRLRR